MTDQNRTAIGLLVDRSGSMARIKDDMEGGLRAFLDAQKDAPGEADLTHAEFDGRYLMKGALQPLDATISINPRGSTALHDAMGRFITEFGEILAALPEDSRPGKVIVVTVTDGEENSSREWTAEQVRALVTQQRDVYSWEFVFLGANQDAVLTAAALGIARGSTLTYNTSRVGTQSTTASLSRYVTAYRGGVGQATFTDADRSAAVQED